MFKVLAITFSGIALGYLLRRMAWLGHLGKSITYTIWLLLLFFGLQVGANEQVVANLDTLGVKALEISVAGVLGSCVTAWILLKCFFRDRIIAGQQVTGPHSTEPHSTGPHSTGPYATGPHSTGPHITGRQEPRGADDSGGKDAPGQGRGIMETLQGFIVVAFFAVGSVAGWLGFFPASLTDGDFSMYVLYALMIQVGMSIGSDKKLKEILCSLRPKLLLLPLGTIVGTLLFVAAASPFISGIILPDSLAIGAGFGYYSLSSVLITQIKEASAGASFAAQLGTVALMANIMREVITLLFAPAICRAFGKLAPISTGGATSMDSTLPVITAVCGKEMVFISIFHGVLVDFSVPFLVTFFASL